MRAESALIGPHPERRRFGRLSILTLALLALAAGGCRRRTTTARPPYRPTYAASTAPASAAPPTELAGHGTSDDPFLLCHGEGGPSRTDYSFVASWHCADGSMPLAGAPMSGAGSRVGNVGPGPDGHIVDLYRVPCPSGPVDLYVDAYHCGAGATTDIDLANLTAHQLENVATSIRELHRDPMSERATAMRRFLLQWVLETRQLTVVFCDGIASLLPEHPPRPYVSELGLALAASVIEDGRDPVDTVETYLSAFAGLVAYYQASLRVDPAISDPRMDFITSLLATGTLRAELATRLLGCDASGMGVHFVRR